MKLKRWKSALVGMLLTGLGLFGGAAFALDVGDKAPNFALLSTTGKEIKLADFAGKQPIVLFFYIGAFTGTWTQEALAFQLDLPKFEAANAQVLGISVDFNDANKAWAEKIGLKYPLMTDVRREMSRAYAVLNDDPTAVQDPKRIPTYLRSKRSWFVVDKEGVVRYARVTDPRGLVPNDEILEVLSKLK
jgi:peroxiredoxin